MSLSVHRKIRLPKLPSNSSYLRHFTKQCVQTTSVRPSMTLSQGAKQFFEFSCIFVWGGGVHNLSGKHDFPENHLRDSRP